MKCPFCVIEFHDEWWSGYIGELDATHHLGWRATRCPACKEVIVSLAWGGGYGWVGQGQERGRIISRITESKIVLPHGTRRPPAPAEVPTSIAEDYTEACLVLADSPKASAALSRRCLQHLLRDAAKTTKKDLADQIQQVLDSKLLPSQLAENIDAIRTIGNFAAHAMKSTATGEIVDVETGEAEWNLDVLESLFDFYYVQPAANARRRDALNAKLKEAGKPPMK